MLQFLAMIGRSAQETLSHWNRIHGSLLAASVSFYACFCVFPVLLILLAGFGFFLQHTGWGQNYEQGLLRYVADQTSQPLAVQIQSLLHQIEASAIAGGPMGGLFLLLTALTLFVNFERCFGIIWERTDRAEGWISNFRSLLVHRLRGFFMLLMIAILIFVNFVSYFVIEWVARWLEDFGTLQRWWQLTHLGSSLLLNALLFTVIYRTLPRQRIYWWAAVQGGVLAAITWEIGRYLLAWLIISDKYHTFGVVGVFMGLMMWAYYGTYVVLLGATLTRVTTLARETAIKQRRLEREGLATDAPATLPFRPTEAYRRRIPLDDAPRRQTTERQVA